MHHWEWGSGVFFPQHLWNSGNQTGSNQHGCPMSCCLQDCKPSQLTPNAPAWRSCWWRLLPPSPQKKTKTSRKEDKQEIRWQTVQPQVAFNIGPKPLGNREVVTSIQVIFYFEETPQCHSHPLWKGGQAESKRQSESASACGAGEEPNKATQQPSLHGHTERPSSSAGMCPLRLMTLLKPWNWGNFNPTEKSEGPLAPAADRGPPLMPHITS